MKKTAKLTGLIMGTFLLAGCSLISGGNDGGVNRSDDGGATFYPKDKVGQNGTISQTDVLSLAVNPQDGNEVYIGTASSGIFKTNDAGENWRQLKVSDLTPTKVYSMAISNSDPKVILAGALVDKRAKIIKSQDGGDTWKDIYTEPSTGSLVLSLALDPLNSQNVYAGTDKGQIIFSEDGGETWRNLLWAQGPVYKIALDYFNPSTAYFVIFQRGLLRTLDGGKSFEDLSQKESFISSNQLGNPTSLAADPNQEGWLYVGSPSGLLRSKDQGENWESVKTLIKPSEQTIRSIAINPVSSDEIVFSVSQAFYKSIDGGVNWKTVQFDVSRTIEVIAYNRQNPATVYVGMNKR
ncbi:MAG: YCF48-related protein [Parcubacteria group bacterium]|jgi:photosystem II stability/assembly factor-like uncharacterized protein